MEDPAAGQVDPRRCGGSAGHVDGHNVATIPTLDLLEEAFSIAATFERTIYDSLYVALAVRLKAQLVTVDERLANALAAHLPVKWFGLRAAASLTRSKGA